MPTRRRPRRCSRPRRDGSPATRPSSAATPGARRSGVVQHADGIAEVGGTNAYLTPDICYRLYRLEYKDDEGAFSQTARAIAVLAHEAWHLHGETDEGVTNCYALPERRRARPAAGSVGRHGGADDAPAARRQRDLRGVSPGVPRPAGVPQRGRPRSRARRRSVSRDRRSSSDSRRERASRLDERDREPVQDRGAERDRFARRPRAAARTSTLPGRRAPRGRRPRARRRSRRRR